jgi:small subunit ribosomal protein S16
MLIMRLRRIGRKSDPHYRVVVAEHTSPVQGKFIAEVGHYHPKTKELVLQKEVIMEWLSKGAQVSNTVAKLLDKDGMSHDRVQVKQYQGQPKKKAQEAAKAKADAAAAPAVEEAPAEEAAETEAETETPAEEATEEVTEEAPAEAEEAPADEASEETEAPAENTESEGVQDASEESTEEADA